MKHAPAVAAKRATFEMKIGLIDVDGRVMRGKKHSGERFPNLALMKLSAWHRANGDEVEFCFPLKRYDRVYASKVFTFTPDIDFAPMTDDFRKDGSGYDLSSRLPDDVEHMMPDYSLYGTKTAYGFMSRGCPRGCPFCIVAEKEGRSSRKVADLREWWDGQKEIQLMDPNVLACPEWRDILGQLVDSKSRVNISQGLDIRLMTDEKCDVLNSIRSRLVHFAWDGNDDLEPLFRKWGGALKWKRNARMVYVLCNFNTSREWDMHRVRVLDDCGYEPYVMLYDREHSSREIRRFQRWVNNKAIFHTTTFDDYNPSKKGK